VNERTDSEGGIAIAGITTAAANNYWGVLWESRSTSGIGVRGQTSATSGRTTGVWGLSRSPDGRGVYGEAISETGVNYGVFGLSLSVSGRGVYGWALATSGTTFGVYGESRSPDGRAVYGLASATSGWNFGVYGESRSPERAGRLVRLRRQKGRAASSGKDGIFREDWPSTLAMADWRPGTSCARQSAMTPSKSRSDVRLKRDIHPLDASGELQRLLSLRPVSYYWRDERLPQTLQYGLIAQELQHVFPELVSEAEDEQKTLAVNYQALIPAAGECAAGAAADPRATASGDSPVA
jgi:hypothetical protein